MEKLNSTSDPVLLTDMQKSWPLLDLFESLSTYDIIKFELSNRKFITLGLVLMV